MDAQVGEYKQFVTISKYCTLVLHFGEALKEINKTVFFL